MAYNTGVLTTMANLKSYNLTKSEIALILEALESYHRNREWQPWLDAKKKAEAIAAELNK
jgi:hypothetical protein